MSGLSADGKEISMTLLNHFLCRTKTAFGTQALAHLPFDLSGMHAYKPFVITDQAARDAGLHLTLARACRDTHLALGLATLTDAEDFETLYHLFADKGYDSFIALGTGQVVQTAKALNLALCHGPEKLRSPAGPGQINRPLLPLVYIPTHPETGQDTAGETFFSGRHFVSANLMPDIAVITADTMLGTPGAAVLDSGLASLATCCEAFAFSGNPFARSYAHAGICLVMDTLLPLAQQSDHGDLLCQKAGKHRQLPLAKLAHAAAVSGYIQSNLPDLKSRQAVAHLTAVHPAPSAAPSSGLCMALALVHLLENSKDTCPWLGKLLLPLTDAAHYAGVPGPGQPDAAVRVIRKLLHALSETVPQGMPKTLGEAGLTPGQISEMSTLLTYTQHKEPPW